MKVTIVPIVIGALVLYFGPGPKKYYSKMIHQKEVTHSNGQ